MIEDVLTARVPEIQAFAKRQGTDPAVLQDRLKSYLKRKQARAQPTPADAPMTMRAQDVPMTMRAQGGPYEDVRPA